MMMSTKEQGNQALQKIVVRKWNNSMQSRRNREIRTGNYGVDEI
jgi:hypothetical protein